MTSSATRPRRRIPSKAAAVAVAVAVAVASHLPPAAASGFDGRRLHAAPARSLLVDGVGGRSLRGSCHRRLLELWDEILASVEAADLDAAAVKTRFSWNLAPLTASQWCRVLCPVLAALLLSAREVILAVTTTLESPSPSSASSRVLTLGMSVPFSSDRSAAASPSSTAISSSSGTALPSLLELARSIREPERLAVLDETIRVVTFQEGPLGIVLGQEFPRGPLTVRKPPRLQAAESGEIEIGDILAAINGVRVPPGLTPTLLVSFLPRQPPVKVAFKRVQAAAAAANNNSNGGGLPRVAEQQPRRLNVAGEDGAGRADPEVYRRRAGHELPLRGGGLRGLVHRHGRRGVDTRTLQRRRRQWAAGAATAARAARAAGWTRR